MVKTGTGSITPRIATVAEVNSNLSNWESQLVTINGVYDITGNSGKFGMDGVLIKDASAGELLLFTRDGSTFSGSAYPTGTRNISGILSIFDGDQAINYPKPIGYSIEKSISNCKGFLYFKKAFFLKKNRVLFVSYLFYVYI
jgi:hypothetical protein